MSKYVYRTGTYGIARYGILRRHVLVLVPGPYRYGIGSRLHLTVCSGSRLYINAEYVIMLKVLLPVVGSVWEFLYPNLGGIPYDTEGEWDLFGCPCGGKESRSPCTKAIAIVTIRRRTEL